MSGRLISLLVLVLLAAIPLGIYFFMQRDQPLACADTKPVIVVFGDSLVTGYGAQAGEDFVSVLSGYIDVPIVNAGRNGDTSASALVRVNQAMQVRPDIVIIVLGGNDALQRIPLTETEENLRKIMYSFASYQSRPIRMVLVAEPGGLLSDPYGPMYARLAEEFHAELVPNVLSGLLGHAEFMSDNIHPNAAGYAKIAAKIKPALERTCSS
jgi:acyl-CoA thioesterase-1